MKHINNVSMEDSVKSSFNRLLHECGGYFDFDEFSINLKKGANPVNVIEIDDFLELHRDVLAHGEEIINHHRGRYVNIPKVHLAYLNNPTLGAVVSKDPESKEYFIGIYYSSVILLREFFSKILCSPKVIPWIGDIEIEKAEKTNNPFIINEIVLREFIDAYPDIRVHPNSSSRILLARNLTMIAIAYLVLHEFGHIAKGHLKYVQSLKGDESYLPLFIDSPYERPTGKIPKIILHALETDADHFANFHGMTMVGAMFGVHPTEESLMRSIELWTFATFSFFRLFSLIPYYKVEHVDKHTHPSAAIRIFLAIDDICQDFPIISKRIIDKEINGKFLFDALLENLSKIQEGIQDICSNSELFILGTVPLLQAMTEYNLYRESMTDIHDDTLRVLSSFKYAFANP